MTLIKTPLVLSVSAAELTIDGQHVLRDAVALQTATSASIASGAPSYTILAGACLLLLLRRRIPSSYNTPCQELVAIRADGAVELWFRVTAKWTTGGVLIKECAEVTISGLTTDYDPPTRQPTIRAKYWGQRWR